jgi:hypothetical protein
MPVQPTTYCCFRRALTADDQSQLEAQLKHAAIALGGDRDAATVAAVVGGSVVDVNAVEAVVLKNPSMHAHWLGHRRPGELHLQLRPCMHNMVMDMDMDVKTDLKTWSCNNKLNTC